MTEGEWLTSTDPEAMLDLLAGKTSDRKLRLYAVECCRRVRKYLTDERCVRAFEVVEQNVDVGRADPRLLTAAEDARAVWVERHFQVLASCVGDDLARRAAETMAWRLTGLTDEATAMEAHAKVDSDPIKCAACAVWVAAGAGRASEDNDALVCNAIVAGMHAVTASGADAAERAAQAHIVRDIFGPAPFRSVAVEPSWLTPDVVALAEGIAAERAFDRLPILADCLQEAGCDDPDVLGHCRGEGPHVTGCWLVELITRRETRRRRGTPRSDATSSGRPARLSYGDSCRLLQGLGLLDGGAIPDPPKDRPRPGDELTHGVRFFRTWVGSGRPIGLQPLNPDEESGLGEHDLENLALPRTFIGRAEVSSISFRNTVLSESTFCWNDFIGVDFTDTDLSECDLRASLYTRCVFVGADLRNADLRRSTFRECDFTDADLRGARLTREQGEVLLLSEEQKQAIDWQDGPGEEPEGG